MRPRLTPRDTTRALCSSAKKPFTSQREALEAKAHAEEKNGVTLSVYQCAECLQWHFTSRHS